MGYKICCYKDCKSCEKKLKKKEMEGVTMISFPKPKQQLERCLAWIKCLGRDDFTVDNVNYETSICSKHFVGGKGPTMAHPLPLVYEKELIDLTIDHTTTIVPTYRSNCEISEDKEAELSFDELWKCLTSLDLPNWSYNKKVTSEQRWINIIKLDPKNRRHSLALSINSNLAIELTVENVRLQENHPMLPFLPRAITSMDLLKKTLREIEMYNVCAGTRELELLSIFHLRNIKNGYISEYGAVHEKKCFQLTKNQRCSHCVKLRCCLIQRRSQIRRRKICLEKPRKTFEDRLKKIKRQNNLLKGKVKRMKIGFQKHITKNGKQLNTENHNLFETILNKSLAEEKDTGELWRTFIETQKKLLQCKNTRNHRWHPLVIKWCLYLYNKSPEAYKTLRESEFLILPCQNTLRNYSNKIGTTPGFRSEVFANFKNQINWNALEEHEKYFIILIDEIKIKEDLIYKKNTGDLVGFSELNDVYQEIASLQSSGEIRDTPPLASHVLQIMIRGITTRYKYTLAFFPTSNLTADKLYSVLWEAIANLELCDIRVLAVVGDGASVIRKTFAMSTNETENYCCKNPYSLDAKRKVFFLSDVPQLLKTVRNSMYDSAEDGKIRLLKKNEKYILWKHILNLFEIDKGVVFRKARKLRYDHVHLTSFSKMRVNLAAQVMSSTVANAISSEFGEEVEETVTFIKNIDYWFDLMNTRNQTEEQLKRKPALAPYQCENDERLSHMQDFLNYLDSWEEEVFNEQNNLTLKEKKKMLLSEETRQGLKMTTKSVMEIIPFLISKGATNIYTCNLNQDILEQEFSKHRSTRGGASNPTVDQYSFNKAKLEALKKTNALRLPKSCNATTT